MDDPIRVQRTMEGEYVPGQLRSWVVWDGERARAAGAWDGDRVVVLTAQDVADAYDHMAQDVEGAVPFAELSPEQQHGCVVAAEEALNRWHWMDWIYESMEHVAEEYRRENQDI